MLLKCSHFCEDLQAIYLFFLINTKKEIITAPAANFSDKGPILTRHDDEGAMYHGAAIWKY